MKTEWLEDFDACDDALEWCSKQRSRHQAWQDCERGDWMLWLLGYLAGPMGSRSRKRLVLCCCEVARPALKHVPKGENRPRVAIETAEAYCYGRASLDEVRAAAKAAADAANAAYDAAAYAAYAAYAYAAYAAANVAYVAADAANVAYGGAYAAAVSEGVREKSANTVRKHYPSMPQIRKGRHRNENRMA